MTSSIITIIICTAIMGMAIWYYWKACQTYDKAEEKERKAMEAERRAEGIKDRAEKIKAETLAEIDDMKEDREKFWSLVPTGLPLRYGIAETNSFYDVFSIYNSTIKGETVCFSVKRFDYGDDKGFALREAEYLLSTLNEK